MLSGTRPALAGTDGKDGYPPIQERVYDRRSFEDEEMAPSGMARRVVVGTYDDDEAQSSSEAVMVGDWRGQAETFKMSFRSEERAKGRRREYVGSACMLHKRNLRAK